jgi:hypothetical protein
LLIVISLASFVFASITTIWYMFGVKFHGWEERREEQKRICYFRLFAFGLGYNTGFA